MQIRLLFIVAIFFASTVHAIDFYLVPQECKSIIGSLSSARLSIVQSDTPTYGCTRSGKTLACTVYYESGGEPTSNSPTESFEILWDSPPALYFSSENGAAFFSVNTQTRVAVMTSRAVDTTYAGQKVCTLIFATDSELNMLKEDARK